MKSSGAVQAEVTNLFESFLKNAKLISFTVALGTILQGFQRLLFPECEC
jgi:hypothetical protein